MSVAAIPVAVPPPPVDEAATELRVALERFTSTKGCPEYLKTAAGRWLAAATS